MSTALPDINLPPEARDHLDKYWALSRRFYAEDDFAVAAFFAITLIEEVGKIVILGNKALSRELDKKGFLDHRRKYAYAVGITLQVNARVTRIYGNLEHVFAKWFREGDLFRIRNSALYLELEGEGPVPPSKAISQRDALLLVCFAGEIYAEIQGAYTGTGPDQWRQVIDEVDAFRADHASILGSA
jgi:AbiV family abortive infection protein